MIEVGRLCIKTVGRESGHYCVVLKKLDDTFVLVTGPKLLTSVKRRRVNITHLKPLEHKLEIKEEASDEEVTEAYKQAGLVTKLGLKLPSAAELKAKVEKEKKEEGKKVAKKK